MSFKGRNLDVVLNPVLIVDVDNDTLRNVSHNDYKQHVFLQNSCYVNISHKCM